jgi:uncharacterized membrane protein (DUF4010 family)
VDSDLLLRLGIALGVGLLIGFQRQRSRASLAGIRTFALIALLGAVSALIAVRFDSSWTVAAAFIALSALLVSGHVARSRTSDPELTTEIAATLVFALGAFAIVGPPVGAVTVGAAAALLLHFKEPLHKTVARLADGEVRAVMLLVLVGLLILPLLPDRAADPLGVLNPYRIWMMVVLIVALGLAGHAALKAFGSTAGTLLMGVLGGLISSTATTVDQSRRSRADGASSALAAIVVILASATTIVRILVEVAAVSTPLLVHVLAPMLVVLVVLGLGAAFLRLVTRGEAGAITADENPAQLRTALVFAALYAVVIVAVAASRKWFGEGGLAVVAVLSGLTDVDAITLSTAQLVKDGRLEVGEGLRVIMLAALSNLAFKGVLVGVLATRRMLVRVAVAFAAAILAGIAALVAWP